MDWKKLLGTITASVDEEIRLRNAYLVAENRMLRQQINGRVQLTDGDHRTLAALGQKLGRQALEEVATVAKAIRFSPGTTSSPIRQLTPPCHTSRLGVQGDRINLKVLTSL